MTAAPSDRARLGRLLPAAIWQVAWGLPQNVLGLMLCLALRGPRQRHRFRAAFVTEWSINAGFTTGMFIFVPRGCPRQLLLHEYGHTLQSLILGPLYLPVIALPSLAWAGIPRFRRFRARYNYSYYRLYCERWANVLARRVTGEDPVGWYPHRGMRRR